MTVTTRNWRVKPLFSKMDFEVSARERLEGSRPVQHRAHHHLPEDSTIVVVGLVRNAARTLRWDVNRIAGALGFAKSVSWFLVEADSTDTTVPLLESLAHAVPGFRFRSLGAFAERMPEDARRDAHCRNIYLDEVEHAYVETDYVVVADFSGLNSHITRGGVLSCWTSPDWDVCTANQMGPYYDLDALRHPVWCPQDLAEYQAFLETYGGGAYRGRLAQFVKLIQIPMESPWIEVESAFGGFAVYRRSAMIAGRYDGADGKGREINAHVALHSQLRAQDYRIFINPGMINTHVAAQVRERTLLRTLMEGFWESVRRGRAGVQKS
ncbi:MAG: hypothetical protein ACFB6R_02055 [Alphaproteobacteria bacterium]